MYGCQSWTIKIIGHQGIDAFFCCGVGEDSWEFLGLQGDQTSRFQRKSILSVHWKDWCWSWSSNTLSTCCEELTHLQRAWCWERVKVAEDEMVGWHHWLNAHEFEWAQGVGDGQGSLACGSPWGCKESDTTEQLNWLTDSSHTPKYTSHVNC